MNFNNATTRSTEKVLVWVRWFAVALGIYLVTQSSSSLIPPPPQRTILTGEAILAFLAAGNVATMLGIRRARTEQDLRWVGFGSFALDSLVVFALVWSASYTPLDTTWVVMYILPLEGALRYKLKGALAISSVSLLSELAREWYLSERFIGYHYSIGSVAFRGGIGFIVALVAGVGWRSLAREAANAAEQAGKFGEAAGREAAARREIAAFNSILLAGLSAEGLDESIDLVAKAIAEHLEINPLAILTKEGDHLVARGTSGVLPGVPGARVPLDEGVLGAVALTGRPILVQDVTAYPGCAVLRPDVCASIAVPIEVGGTVIGVLDLQTSQPDLFTEETLEVARRLAAQIALVIQNVLLRAHERETLAKLRELDQLKSDFLAIANHELRTPIAAVRGFLRTLVLHRQQLSPEEVDEFLTRADRRSEDLARLVDDLLSMSRLEAGPVTLRLEETDLEVLARDTLDLFPDEERARVTLEVTGSRPRVRADTRRLGQILRNLVHNALKFSSPDSPVNVSLAVEDEWLEIEVTDRGVGIPQQELPVIFEAFRQVAGHMTRESDGLGLGLYVVRTLVDAMEGEIRVQSRPGVGSTFAVAVPLSDQSTSSPADRGSNEELLAAGN